MVVQVSSSETHYRCLQFYLEEHPELLVDLLAVLQVGGCMWVWVGWGECVGGWGGVL